MPAGGGAAPLRLLGISGSLRAGSSNTAIIHTAALVAPEGVVVDVYAGIATLPFFSPDLDRELDDPALPAPVRAMRAAVAGADGLVISSPEYAHGVPGVLKNALDWLVGGPEMVDRPVLLLNTSSHSVHAQASLAETLRTMSARLVTPATIDLPRGGPMLDPGALAADPSIGPRLALALGALVAAITRR